MHKSRRKMTAPSKPEVVKKKTGSAWCVCFRRNATRRYFHMAIFHQHLTCTQRQPFFWGIRLTYYYLIVFNNCTKDGWTIKCDNALPFSSLILIPVFEQQWNQIARRKILSKLTAGLTVLKCPSQFLTVLPLVCLLSLWLGLPMLNMSGIYLK